jgi:hypothetical protein
MILKIFQDSHGGRSACRSCGAPIEWAETVAGKKMPFDWPIMVLRHEGNPIKQGERVVEEVNTDISASHFATCPDAKTWSRRAGKGGR